MRIFLLIIFVFGLFLSFPLIKSAHAASLNFDPATANTSAGQTFQIKVNVDAGTDQINAVEARIVYDQNLMDVQEVSNGTFFPSVTKYITHDGKLYVSGMVDSTATAKTGTGTIATITFIAQKAGTGTLTYECQSSGSTDDSNIIKNDTNATDIIQCSSNGKADVVIAQAGSSATTITPTSAQLLKSGIMDNVIKYSVSGGLLLLVGAVIKMILL